MGLGIFFYVGTYFEKINNASDSGRSAEQDYRVELLVYQGSGTEEASRDSTVLVALASCNCFRV